MATWYTNSAAGGTGAGTSWVNACTTLTAVLGKAIAAGDDFDIASASSTSEGASPNFIFPGTASSPNRMFSCGTTNAPATAPDLAAGSTVGSTGTAVITGSVYVYGITFSCTAIALGREGSTTSSQQTYDGCTFAVANTGALNVGLNGTTGTTVGIIFTNTNVNFAATSGSIVIGKANFIWQRGTLGGAAVPTTLITAAAANGAGIVLIEDVDLSVMGSGKTIVGALGGPVTVQLLNCKLGASVTVAATPTVPGTFGVDLINSDSSATGYRQERYRYQGTLTTSTAVYNAATDGVTPISWQVVTTANAKRQSPFDCFEIVQWAPAGTYAATIIQCTSATGSLTNADIWAEAEFLGNGSFPIASLVSSGPATQLTTGASLAAGTWAHGGLGNNYQLAMPSFTTAIAGYIRFTVHVAKASLTINVDPDVTVA